MQLSAFGEKFAAGSGILDLMCDLAGALNERPDVIFMGGGNPSRLQEVESVFQQRLQQIMSVPDQRHRLFGIYQSPQGEREFRQRFAAFLNGQFGWQLGEQNIAVSNGSQSAFFVLFKKRRHLL